MKCEMQNMKKQPISIDSFSPHVEIPFIMDPSMETLYTVILVMGFPAKVGCIQYLETLTSLRLHEHCRSDSDGKWTALNFGGRRTSPNWRVLSVTVSWELNCILCPEPCTLNPKP